VGIVDSQKIFSTYAGAVDAGKELEAENQKWAQELQQLDDELKRQREELERQRLLLSEARRQEREQEIGALTGQIKKFREDKWGENGEYFRKQQELMRPVIERINRAINQIAEEDKYDLILDTVQGNVLYARERFDITPEVIDLLESEAP